MASYKRILATLLLCATASGVYAQSITPQMRRDMGETLTRIAQREITVGNIKVQRTTVSRRCLTLYTNIDMSYYPFREDNIPPLYDSIRAVLPERFADWRIRIITDRHDIEELVPRPLRSDTIRAGQRFVNRASRPLVTRLSSPSQPRRGLAGRHIAMWQSHGLYFDNASAEWQWQRARLWGTVEDLYTQSYVLPFLVPMLENAGANVLLPRERDTQTAEVVVDNDVRTSSVYDEYTGDRTWYTGPHRGFAARRDYYTEGQNPFAEGTYRASECVGEGADESRIVWTPDIPAEGEYAVYVSYSTEDDSADDAHYTVYHLGGETEFAVNQRIGGGTWIYLGKFRFAAGANEAQGSVTLSNRSAHGDRATVTADAVRFGGGYGNIARIPVQEKRNPDIVYEYQTSQSPRFVEGARYWLQWAGFPEKVYNPKENADDYRDDYMSRAHWVNYLMGGSERLPDSTGMGVPVDMAFAFHSDAGAKFGDETVGTLGIFFTRENGGRFDGGASRYLSRDLADMVLSSICRDVRTQYEPQWSRRGLWNRSYYEARVPSAPTMLLELLSHQNFADMRYGLDPRFRFAVSRAIYKGILRYLAYQYEYDCVVQPLPVRSFAVELAGDDSVRLSWRPRIDTLEATAVPDRYIVYTRIGDGAFDNGRIVEDTVCLLRQPADTLCSYRVVACNDGGMSFPSETLAACRRSDSKGCVMVINGFERVSAPLSFQGDSIAGFFNHIDGGVPYLSDISFIGSQREFRRSETLSENYNECLGSCYSDYATEELVGNTFDYPAQHGRSIAAAGYSFCSASVEAVENLDVRLNDYLIADLILGKQRATAMGRGAGGIEFRTFSPSLRLVLRHFASVGRRLMVSGSYVGSDLWHGEGADADAREFAREVLHYRLAGWGASRRGVVRVKPSPAHFPAAEYRFNTELCRDCYAVESPDALAPVGEGAFTLLQYPDSRLGAAVAYDGNFRSVVMGFPFETIQDETQRNELMKRILGFFEYEK